MYQFVKAAGPSQISEAASKQKGDVYIAAMNCYMSANRTYFGLVAPCSGNTRATVHFA
jgi:hypothetical protein